MSTSPESKPPESELDLDLQFLPAWAQQAPDTNRYAKYKGDEGGFDRKGGGRGREGGRSDRSPGRGPGGPGQDRGRGPQRPGGRPSPGGYRSQAPDSRGPREEREAAPPLPDIAVNFYPEEKGVESLARQIKLTGRAYPLFDIAFLVLKKPERYHVQFSTLPKQEGQPGQSLFVCSLDDTLWLSEQEAVDHVLHKHFSTFYQSERIPTDPPKGTYTFVAQCGMSGTILGPPNYHDYQNKLRQLHAERFSRVPFDLFKSRIKIVKEEATVKKWIDDQSWKTEYIGLNVPEPLKLTSREEVEKHFRQTHLPNVVRTVDNFTVSGLVAQNIPSRPLQNLVRRNWDDQMRFPIKVVNILSQQFARQGLNFFKVNKTVTHVAVARPRFLDMTATPVSEGVKKIVDYIDSHPKCSRRKLIEVFAPEAMAQPASAAEGEKPAEAAPPSPEAAALVSNLHWLIHEGHVIEFANGQMETAKKPPERPIPPPKPIVARPAQPAASAAPAAPAENNSTEEASSSSTASEPAPIEQPLVADSAAPAQVAEAAPESPASSSESEQASAQNTNQTP